MVQPSASAEGDLARIPFAHLLVYALDHRLSGAIFLTQPEGVEHVVRLVAGVPVKTRPGDRYALLGEKLVEAGAIDEATLQSALATQGLLGDVLLLAGRVERDALETIAERQFVLRMVRLFALPKETAFCYRDADPALADYGGDPSRVDPLAILWAGLRVHGECSTLMEATLAVLGDKAMRLHPSSTIARFGLDSTEARLHAELKARPLTLAEADALEVTPPATVRRFAYAMLITRQLELGTAGAPLGSAESARSLSPAGGMTAVGRMQLRSTLHRVGAAAPDLPGDGERRASRRSSDPGAPPSSTRASARTSSPPSTVEELLAKASQLLAKRDEKSALALKSLLAELDALLVAQEHVPARYCRATLREQAGDQAGALADLQRVCELDPSHTKAARELASLRARTAKTPRPSLFGGLFKR